MTRLFQSCPLEPGKMHILDTASSHRLADVLRLKSGDPLTLFNGTSGEFAAQIETVKKNQVSVRISHHIAREAESPLAITLALGISRGEKMDLILQKSVELGVAAVVPLFTEFCNVKLDKPRIDKKGQHWQKIIISACEQCGRNQIPLLAEPIFFSSWLNGLTEKNFPYDHAFLFSPTATLQLRTQSLTHDSRVLLFTGPEGGFSPAEIAAIATKNVQMLTLGPRILRTETAALAALTALQIIAGDMG